MAGTDRAKNKAKIAEPTVQTLGITLLLNVSSTTDPIRRHIGSVVELMFNKRVVQGSIPATHSGPTWGTRYDVILLSA